MAGNNCPATPSRYSHRGADTSYLMCGIANEPCCSWRCSAPQRGELYVEDMLRKRRLTGGRKFGHARGASVHRLPDHNAINFFAFPVTPPHQCFGNAVRISRAGF